MSTKYMIIRNSVQQAAYVAQGEPHTETGKLFPVIMGGYAPSKQKIGSYERAVDGTLDVSAGGVYYVGTFNIRLRHTLRTEDPANLGTLEDLDTYFCLNNPSPVAGHPSNLITLVDHFGIVRHGFLVGQFTPEPFTTIIEGSEANYLIQITFMQKDKVA